MKFMNMLIVFKDKHTAEIFLKSMLSTLKHICEAKSHRKRYLKERLFSEKTYTLKFFLNGKSI